MPDSLKKREVVIDSLLPDGNLADCHGPTADGKQLICAEIVPGDGQDRFVGVITMDVAPPHRTAKLRTASFADSNTWAGMTGAASDSDWIVWAEETGDPNSLADTNWSIYVSNRSTHRTHLVARAKPSDVKAQLSSPYILPRIANNRVWWAAVTSQPSGDVCRCGYSAPVAGGTAAVFARDILSPQALSGPGDGPFGTTVYAESPNSARTDAVLRRIAADGTPMSTVARDEPINAVVAGPAGLAWQRAGQGVLIRFAPPDSPPIVASSLGVQQPDALVLLGADQLCIGGAFIAWSQGNGGMLYDAAARSLYRMTDYPSPLVSANGNTVVWGVESTSGGLTVDDPMHTTYHVLTLT